MSGWLLPLLLTLVLVWGTARQIDVSSVLTRGAREGLESLARILSPLVGLLTVFSMFRASGALDWLTALAAPLLSRLGIPPETVPLLLIRPLSGSGALAVTDSLLASCGPDSLAGRTAAVMMGSTETTFYTVAVYFGAAGITRSRHTIPAALAADLTGFLVASVTARCLL